MCKQPNHSSCNAYDNKCCVQSTASESAVCDNEIEYSTESEDSVCLSSESKGHSSKNRITPEQSSVSISIHCLTVKVKMEKVITLLILY